MILYNNQLEVLVLHLHLLVDIHQPVLVVVVD
jgi:hypothetical protein